MISEEEKSKRRLFYINQTQNILEKQIQSKFFIQTTATGLIAFLALFITLTLSLISSNNICFKILVVIPIILASVATYFLMKNIKYKKSFTGINYTEVIKNINSTYEDSLKLSLNTNIESIKGNETEILHMGSTLHKAIKYLLWSVGLLILLLIFNNFTKMSENKKTEPNKKPNDSYVNDEKFSNNTNEQEDSDYFEVSRDSLMATNKEKETLKKKEKQKQEDEQKKKK